jgi:hypothetical protein
MISLCLVGILLSIAAFFITKRLPAWVRYLISGAILLLSIVGSLYLFSKIDEPPPGSRIITQEEMNSWNTGSALPAKK